MSDTYSQRVMPVAAQANIFPSIEHHIHRRIAWGAILGGVVLAISIQILLSLLGAGVGLGTVDAAAGSTPVLVTHDIEEAAVLADRIAVLTPHPGRLKAVVMNPLARPRRRDDEALLSLKQDLRALLQPRRFEPQRPSGSMWSSFRAGLDSRNPDVERGRGALSRWERRL